MRNDYLKSSAVIFFDYVFPKENVVVNWFSKNISNLILFFIFSKSGAILIKISDNYFDTL